MRRTIRLIAAGVMSAAVLVAGTEAMAKTRGEGPGPAVTESARASLHDSLAKELNLTPEQQALIKEQRTRQREAAQGVREQMQEKRRQLREELEKEDINLAKVNELTAEMKALSAETIDNRVAGILAMKEVLTKEQFRQLHEKMQRTKEHRKGKFKNFFRDRDEGGDR